MAKKQPKGQLGDWLEEVPEAVQEAADTYDKAHTATPVSEVTFPEPGFLFGHDVMSRDRASPE